MARFLYKNIIAFVNLLLAVLPTSFLRVGLLRVFGASIGSGAYIAARIKVEFPWRLSIGINSYISSNVFLDCRGGKIFIGSNTDVSEGAKLYTLTHDINSTEFSVITRDVVIGSRVWICAMSIILPGSIVNNGCVIGSNSVYCGTSSANSLYLGNHAKLIKALPENRSTNVRKR